MNERPISGFPEVGTVARWFWKGREYFQALETAIARSLRTIRFETYIFDPDSTGRRILRALESAASRGVQVRLMVDGFHAPASEGGFWNELRRLDGEVRIFNPLWSSARWIRDHRKVVVIDDDWAALGGFNVSDPYTGDGCLSGWLDCGLELRGPGVKRLSDSFDDLWQLGGNRTQLDRYRRRWTRPAPASLGEGFQLLLSGPGQVGRSFPSALRADLEQPGDVRFAVAYFLPGLSLRRSLIRTARQGRRVRLLLPGITDVTVARRAARSLYAGFLLAGIEIFEYAPQILHAKLFSFAHAAYSGSANLDIRSLRLNHELMIRMTHPDLVLEAADTFDRWILHARRIDPVTWKNSRSGWERCQERLAFWLLARLDPFLAHRLGAKES